MRKIVGIDRKIKRAWLDKVLDRIATTTDEAELRPFLDRTLKDELPGRESRAKSAGIILRIWSGIPKERVALRDRAVALLAKVSGPERIWLHWGMTALAYPFFRDAAEVVGRLLALQDDFTTAQVQARLLTAWGDRATSKQAAQKLLTTLLDWEVLRPSKTKGQFLLARKITTGSTELQLWLLEALLGANAADEIEAQQLLRLPEAFPFTLSVGVADLRKHEGFNIHRQGLDMDMVALRKVRVEQPEKAKKPRKAKPKKAATAQPSLFDRQSDEVAALDGQPLGPSDAPFAAPIAECADMVRQGHFYAATALAQVVVEAAVLLVWRVKVRKRRNQPANFPKAVEALRSNSLIGEACIATLDRLRSDRDGLLLRRPTEDVDSRLEAAARSSMALLEEIAGDFFGHSEHQGVVTPDHPEYWSAYEAETPVLAGD